jgi:hypothetical protein
MAEQEVVKHTKKIYTIWNDKKHGVWHKAKELLIEIFIIVFAVSLSIWVHDKSEHNHQQKEVKEFLLGLRGDLMSDINEMNGDKISYAEQTNTFNFITNVKHNTTLSIDSLNKHKRWIFNTTKLQQNNGRFEGFKSAGKIGNIEDKKMQNDIMDLYQESIPALLASTDGYIHWKNELYEFYTKNLKRLSDTTSNISTIITSDEAQNICGFLTNTSEIIERYDTCINKMKTILGEIENNYGAEK